MNLISSIFFILSECYNTPGDQQLHIETGVVCLPHDQGEPGFWVFVRSVTVV